MDAAWESPLGPPLMCRSPRKQVSSTVQSYSDEARDTGIDGEFSYGLCPYAKGNYFACVVAGAI
eukprot:6464559-Amphidinium_carterae.1